VFFTNAKSNAFARGWLLFFKPSLQADQILWFPSRTSDGFRKEGSVIFVTNLKTSICVMAGMISATVAIVRATLNTFFQLFWRNPERKSLFFKTPFKKDLTQIV